MKVRNLFGALVVLLAVILATGGILVGNPERDELAAERISLPLHPTGELPGRDDADQVIFSEDWENDADGWETSDLTFSAFHVSDFRARGEDDNLWWCGDTITETDSVYVGYNNQWLQYIDTPVLNLANAGDELMFTFDALWLLEDPRRVPAGLGEMDAWDGWLVMISEDGGESFDVLRPEAPAYTAEHISAAERFMAFDGDWPGWCFESAANGRDGWEAADDVNVEPEWLECSFDLSNFRTEQVVIRMIVLTDRTVSGLYSGVGEGNYYLRNGGVFIDNLLLEDGDGGVFLSNNADDDPEPADLIPGHVPEDGDTWALNDDDVHAGNFSMWNDDNTFGARNTLDSPSFEVPDGFNTHFEFWVHCDLPDSVLHAASGQLADFYQVFASADDGETWTTVLWEYKRVEAGGDGWTHYVPGIHWEPTVTDLSLTQFAGQEVRLRWQFNCDFNHVNVNDVVRNGTGLFIDDIQVISENRQPRDAAMENLNIPYPTTVRSRTDSMSVLVINYGTRDLTNFPSYWGWRDQLDHARRIPFPPRSLAAGDSLQLNITDGADRNRPGWTPVKPGLFTLYTYTAVGRGTPQNPDDDDQNPANDSIAVTGVRVWPAGLTELGYDNRTVTRRNEFARGTGAATRFSPANEGLEDYGLAFAHFRFNGGQQAPATFRLHVRQAGQNENTPGADIVAIDVEVPPDSTLPGHMTVDLSGQESLRDLSGDFWLWAEVTSDNFNPQILSDITTRGAGHYFRFDGNAAQAFDGDFMMHATVVPAGSNDPNLAESEQLFDFGETGAGATKTRKFALYSTGLNPVTIRGVSIADARFDVEFPGETTLRTGEALWLDITFSPPDDGIYSDTLRITSTDGVPPSVTVIGVGSLGVTSEDPFTPASFHLAAPYPNPFNSTSRIAFAIGQAGEVKLGLYDISGRQVANLIDTVMPSGSHSALLKADILPAGLYIVKLESAGRVASQKVLLVR